MPSASLKNEKNPKLKQSALKMTSSISSNLANNVLNTPLDEISVNPFVNKIKFSYKDYFRIYVLGLILCIIRIFPMLLSIVLASVLAKTFWVLHWILGLLHVPSNSLKKAIKFLVFGCIRCAFFFSGFYWIKVTDKSDQDSTSKPKIIPIAPHSTFFDVILLIKLGVPAIVSRFENSKMCLVGSILKLCEPVYVKRDQKSSRTKAADDIKARALIGHIMIFPEGTCTNRTALIQFKMGAFLPQLPVHPVVVKWNLRKHDIISWTEEGPGIARILFYTLGQWSTECEIIKLPAYAPNDEEKGNTRLFADNVAKVMCNELGVLQSFYSYDDVMFMGFANEIKIFRSPVCIKLLKVCYKIIEEIYGQENASSSLSKVMKVSKFTPIFSPKYLGFGEDFEHKSHVSDFYIPKVLLKLGKKIKESTGNRSSFKKLSLGYFKRLPLSGILRKKFDVSKTTSQVAVTSQKQQIYETFCSFIEKSINHIEEKAELRPIQSTEDLAELLNVDKYANTESLIKSSSLVDLLKALEFSTIYGPTTLHLLVALHLCDCREQNLWERMRACMTLLSANRKNYLSRHDSNKSTEFKSEPTNKSSSTSLSLIQFKTLLWYSLGLQEFNDCFFIRQDFDFEFVKNNLKRMFSRAVEENAQYL